MELLSNLLWLKQTNLIFFCFTLVLLATCIYNFQLEKEIQAKEQERREKVYSNLSGQIAGTKSPRSNYRSNSSGVPQQVGYDTDFDTLDEPVWETISRDLKLVSGKFSKVLVPASKEQNILRDWDLWGPLFICVALSLYVFN